MSNESSSLVQINKLINELNITLKNQKTILEPSKVESFLNHLFLNESTLQEILEKEGSTPFFELGGLLLQAFQKVNSNSKHNFQKVLFKFLDLGKSNLFLQKVCQENKQTVWFEILLSIIKGSNFTIGQLFNQRVNNYRDKPLFTVLKEKSLIDHSWFEIQEKVDAIARSLFSFTPENTSMGPVAILSENSLEMACIDLACLITGCINVLIPANSIVAQVEYILNHSKAEIIFVSNEEQLKKVLNCRRQLKNLQHIVILQSFDNTTDADIITFHDYLEQGKNIPKVRVQTAIEIVKVDDLATIMYTSGTTEAPKGIMFSQLNIVSKRFARAIALPEIGDQDRLLCYLPFFHTFGRFFEMMGCIFWGSIYVFMESPKFETMIENFQLAKPTVFISIPKKWMQLFEKIQEKVDIDVASPSTIQAEISNITGGHLKWGLSAAGYLDPDIFQFFQNYGIELMSGFGMTEATGGITMTPPYQYRHNSVGKALPGIEINLAEDGEMRIRGPYVMMGYFQSESVSFRDGWFDTGDIFSKDAEEFYQILDRKKEIYKNIRGETIAPQKIENLFLDFDSIKHVFLVGDHRAYNSLLLYPNYDYDQLDFSKMNHEELREFFSSLIVSVNRFLAPYERIVDFAIIERDFDTEKGELTPKGTFKRKVVEKNFEEIIRNLYQQDYATLSVGAFEIRIPNWFLREKALTSDDLKLDDNTIVINPSKSKLQVHFADDRPGVVRIGTFTYSSQYDYFDIGQLIQHPSLWLGNIEFENFVGEEIFRWCHLNDENDSELKLVNFHGTPKYEQSITIKLNKIVEQNHKNLPGIHYSAYLISTCNESTALQAFDYLESIIQDKNEKLAMVAKAVLKQTSHLENKAIKKQAFRILITNEKRNLFKNIFRTFLQTDGGILDEEIITKISARDLAQNQIKDIFSLLKDCADQEREHGVESPQNTILSLLNLITCYGVMHPVWYKSIRSELVKWTLYETDKEVAQFAEMCVNKLVSNFRDWLGTNGRIAVDPETTQEYRWDDIITFEEDIHSEDKDKIFKAIQNVPLVREAIFIFSGGTLVRLQDFPHNGIWVSFLGSLHGKSVYRVSVQTRHYGAFDIAININQSLSDEEVNSEILWLICAGAAEDRQPLVEDFGGYWPEYGLWTEEFIPGETVEKFLKRLDRHLDEEWVDRMQLLWPNFAWSGLSAYVDFWNRTGRQLMVADPGPANVIVPSHDYQVGFRIVSISERIPFKNMTNMILAFRRNFIDSVEKKYKKLQGTCSWHVIFSSFLEVLGEKEGVQILEEILPAGGKTTRDSELFILYQKLNTFINTVYEKSFLPKRLHFAIQRYWRWYHLNPTATPQARMHTLQELYTTYTMENLEKAYPGIRIQFFRDTIFAHCDKKIIAGLNQIVQDMKKNKVSDDELLDKISELRGKISFNAEEEFFLTRMTYPHLRPQDSAQLISLSAYGGSKTDLVVFFEDQEGNKLSIRQPASPKEIVRLHRLFTIANLPVQFLPEHKYLVVLNERAQVICGLFYRYTATNQVHLEKIVVDERKRKKGVSDGLLKEFFNRLRSQGVTVVTVGYLRPEYFYKFGFKIDRRYGNLVKKLEPETKTEFTDEFVTRL